MQFRAYDAPRDLPHVARIWQECGWISDDAAGRKQMQVFLEGAEEAWVAEIRGAAECLVVGAFGTLRFQDRDLSYGLISAVTTSFVARHLGLAGGLTAHVAARLAQRGAAVTGLGMFEQGFYDKLGFGTGVYDHFAWLAPRSLRVPRAKRPPLRFGVDDIEDIHACRQRRLRWHGAVTMAAIGDTHETLLDSKRGVGLGFRDRVDGGISHMLWLNRDADPELGPFKCMFLAYETWPQLRELLGVLKNLGEQVRLVRVYEPPGMPLRALWRGPDSWADRHPAWPLFGTQRGLCLVADSH